MLNYIKNIIQFIVNPFVGRKYTISVNNGSTQDIIKRLAYAFNTTQPLIKDEMLTPSTFKIKLKPQNRTEFLQPPIVILTGEIKDSIAGKATVTINASTDLLMKFFLLLSYVGFPLLAIIERNALILILSPIVFLIVYGMISYVRKSLMESVKSILSLKIRS